jgi:hypothetical protein
MIGILAICCYFLISIWRIFVEVVDVLRCIISRVELTKFNVFLSMCRAGLGISFVFLSSVLIAPSLLFLWYLSSRYVIPFRLFDILLPAIL